MTVDAVYPRRTFLKQTLTTAVAAALPVFMRASAQAGDGAVAPSAGKTRAEGRSLFDGRTLEGWTGDSKVWRVQDGIIAGGSMKGNPHNDFLTTTASFKNFVFTCEYKLTGTEGFVNSGVQFRSVRLQHPAYEMSGYQADIGAGYSGCLYDESRRKKVLVRPPAELIKRIEKPGEWNRYEIRCEGPHIRITLNGEKTVDFTEADPAIPVTAGLIGLQIHGNNKAEVFFRNIRITEFP